MNGQGNENASEENASLSQWVADSLSVDAWNKQSICKDSECSEHDDRLGLGCKLRAIEPPFDEQKDHEVYKERIHHSYSKNDRVRVFKSCLNDCRVFFIDAVPLY